MRRKAIIDTNSIGFFNFARGCGICFVIAYHSVILFQPFTYQKVFFGNFLPDLGAGLMAMFFIISGHGFYEQKIKKCIKTQARLLLKPYAYTACLVIIAKFGLAIVEHRSFWKFGGQYIFSYLFAVNDGWRGTIFGLKVDHVAMFWFFWSLFGGWVIYNFIQKSSDKKIKIILVLCSVFLGWMLTIVSKLWFYMIPNMLIVVGYIFVGHQMSEQGWLKKVKLSIPEYIVLLSFSLITLVFGGIDMYSFTWILGPVDILGSVCIGVLFCRFFAWLSTFELENKITETIKYIGFNTLWILCIHAFEEKVFPWYRLEYLFPEKIYLAIIVCFVLRCIVIFMGLKLIEFVSRTVKRMKRKGKRPQIVIE